MPTLRSEPLTAILPFHCFAIADAQLVVAGFAAVLSGDILTIPEAEITDVRVDYTIVGGEIRFAR